MRSNEYFEAVKSHLEKEGYAEEITEANFVVPQESDYVDFGEETEEWDIAADRPGLWENIRRKKQREGDNYKPAKPGDPNRPTPDQLKRAQGPCKCSDDSTEALQYGKPPKNDPRKTPAPKKDQKRGSKKNKPDSAKKPPVVCGIISAPASTVPLRSIPSRLSIYPSIAVSYHLTTKSVSHYVRLMYQQLV